MLAEAVKSAARGKVSYVELMLTPDGTPTGVASSQIGAKVGWDGNFEATLEYGVPVALATDDEGVARSEISREYLKAAEDHGLGYLQLKTMARNSLQYAFIAGESLWRDGRKFVPVTQCTRDVAEMKLTSNTCRQFLAANEKSRLQWQLEQDLNAFEREW